VVVPLISGEFPELDNQGACSAVTSGPFTKGQKVCMLKWLPVIQKVSQYKLVLLGEQAQKQSLIEDMLAEKAQVALLQMDLQAMNLAHIPRSP
jgi:hypothetical protein